MQDKRSRGMCKINVAGEGTEGRGRGELQDKSSRVRGAGARRHGKGARLKQQRKVQDTMAGERCKSKEAWERCKIKGAQA